MRRARLCVLSALVLCCSAGSTATGCGAGTPATTRPAADPLSEARALAARAAAFDAWELGTLRELAAIDPRLAARFGIEPTEEEVRKATMGAILSEDDGAQPSGLSVLGDALDLFSFAARARALDAQKEKLAHATEPPETAPRESVARPVARPGLELELLERLVSSERARVDDEQRLPRGASELVRGVVLTWRPATSMPEAAARDLWLARRLDLLRDSLAAAQMGLRSIEIAELEDALDPLERLADPGGYAGAHAAIARLRLALAATRASSDGSGQRWEDVRRGLATHLGVALDAPAPLRTLEGLERALRDEADGRLARLEGAGATDAAGVKRSAEALVLGTSPEPVAVAGSRVRGAAPPPERAATMAALRWIALARGDRDTAVAVVALHDDVAIALWAHAIAADDEDPERARMEHRLLAAIPAEREARLVRLAATRPLVPLGVALALAAVHAESSDGRAERASRWLAFGDAPFDIALRELALTPRLTLPTGAPERASPRP